MEQFKQKKFKVGGAIILIVALLAVLGSVIWHMQDTSPSNNSDQTDHKKTQSTDPNKDYVVIKEWGIRFKPVEGLSGVQYYKVDSDATFFAFTTEKLAKADANCSAYSNNIVLGGISRTTEADGIGKQYGPINGYYYYTRASSAACSSRPNDLEGPARQMLLKSLDTLEAAQ